MKPPFIFSFLRIATGFLFYSLILITLVVIGKAILTFTGNASVTGKSPFTYEAVAVGLKAPKVLPTYSSDKLIRYTAVSDRYRLEVEPHSALGYYAFFSTLLKLMTGITILWLFRRIFAEANLVEPFKQSIFKRLRLLAILFAASDIVGFIHYFLVNHLVERGLSTPEFELVSEAGNGIITGLIIYAIAIIYRQGLSIQQENALTV